MKLLKTFSVSMLAFAIGASALAGDPKSRRSEINISSVVIPSGFDNSSPIAVLSGLFPNSCYKWDKSDVTHVNANLHEIRSYAQIRDGYCLMVMVPFSEEVALGTLSSGRHTLRFINADGSSIEKSLDVE